MSEPGSAGRAQSAEDLRVAKADFACGGAERGGDLVFVEDAGGSELVAAKRGAVQRPVAALAGVRDRGAEVGEFGVEGGLAVPIGRANLGSRRGRLTSRGGAGEQTVQRRRGSREFVEVGR